VFLSQTRLRLSREVDECKPLVAGLHGAIVTTIRALLTPQPLREIRIKANYTHHKEIEAAMGVKIVAQGLETAVAGTAMLVLGPEDDVEVGCCTLKPVLKPPPPGSSSCNYNMMNCSQLLRSISTCGATWRS